MIQDELGGEAVVIAGSNSRNFIVSYKSTLSDGTMLDSSPASTANSSAIILTDNEGTEWNVFGEAVAGPREGEKLTPTVSFIGYWFSWGAFYPGLGIYGN